MDAKELADILDESDCPLEIDKSLLLIAKDNGLVIVYGASDDLMEFRGAIDDEIDAYDGTAVALDSNGLIKNKCDESRCPYFMELWNKGIKISAVWCEDGWSWTYRTDIPHETFEVLDGEDKYCRGIVFSLADVKKGDDSQ